MTNELEAKLKLTAQRRRDEEAKTTPNKAIANIDESVYSQVLDIIKLQYECEMLTEYLDKGVHDDQCANDMKAQKSANFSEMKELLSGFSEAKQKLAWFNVFEAKRLAGSWEKASKAADVKVKVKR